MHVRVRLMRAQPCIFREHTQKSQENNHIRMRFLYPCFSLFGTRRTRWLWFSIKLSNLASQFVRSSIKGLACQRKRSERHSSFNKPNSSLQMILSVLFSKICLEKYKICQMNKCETKTSKKHQINKWNKNWLD